MQPFAYKVTLDTPEKVKLEFSGFGSLELTRFSSFPQEWKLVMDLPHDIQQTDFDQLIVMALPYVEQRKGEKMVVIIDDDVEFEELCRKGGFETYFVQYHSTLNLLDFGLMVPDVEGITFSKWADLHAIDHTNDQYLSNLKELYQVEYQADYEVRQTGRWDMFNPDPMEFVKRFVERQAIDELMVVAIHNDDIIGLCYPWLENDEEAGIFFTGTIPTHIGRGIATAMKIALAQLLKGKGYKRLITWNRDTNSAILRTNEKLGFVHSHSKIYLHKYV